MKICLNCGTACQDEMNFCHKCGKPLNNATDFDATVKTPPQNSNIPVKPDPAVQNIPPVAEPENATVPTRNNPAYRPAENIAAAPVYGTPVVPPVAVPSQSAAYIPAAPQNPTPPQPVYNAPVTPVVNTPIQTINNTPYASPTNIPEQPVNNTPCVPADNDTSQPEGAPHSTPPAYIPWQTTDGQNSQENNTDYNPDIPPIDTRDNPENHNKKKKLIRNLIIIFILLAGIAAGAFFFLNEYNLFPAGSATHSADNSDNNPKPAKNDGTGLFSDDSLSYVMIYNPGIYSEQEKNDTSFLNTGDFNALQVYVADDRSDGIEEDKYTLNTITTGNVDTVSAFDIITPEKNKNSAITEKEYSVDDVADFYHYTDFDNSTREADSFTCLYAGKSCYIWCNNSSVDYDDAQRLGKAFDNIYDKIIKTFGKPRFSEKNGKVNFLFYEFSSMNTLGVTSSYDIYASDEVTKNEITKYRLNTDHTLVHINSIYVAYEQTFDSILATMAHEVQHYISYTSTLSSYTLTPIGVWLDEAMSGYIEEIVSPGTKTFDGHYDAFNESKPIKTGQSLYNFSTNTDIGVYGSVYLFSEYLASANGGSVVFTNIHDYWRNSYSDTLSDAEAIFNSVSDSTKETIDNLVDYPENISFASKEEEWISKLTLDFYLKYLNKNSRINNFSKITQSSLLYNNLNGADIEGGGRIIIAVKNGEFEIPEDADTGLVYVGLDKNFKQITEIVCK